MRRFARRDEAPQSDHRRNAEVSCSRACRDADENDLSVKGGVHLHVAVAVKVHDPDDDYDHDHV